MTVNKLTTPPTAQEQINKINEIIDNLGGGGTAPVWGNITGTLSDQTDLQNALNAKANTSSLATVATSGSYNDLSNKPTIPSVDQTYSASSANAQSGVAIAGANFLVNNAADSTNGVAVKGSGSVQSTQIGALGSAVSMSTSVGFSAYATGSQSITIGHGAQASASKSYAFGEQAKSTAIGAFQFGQATNNEAGSVYFGLTTDGSTTTNYKLLGSDGIIPNARINMDTTVTASSTNAITSGAVSTALQTKQDTLVSGTNIKTINNNSILGSGNLTLDGLPSQTGNAGLYLQTDGTDASWQGVPSRNIGEIVQSTIPLTDAGLHLLDGALINGSGIYSDFVDYVADLYTAGPTASYFTTEANWQTAVTNYGVCGKFVYDSVNNTVRLPKYSNKIYTQELDATAPIKGNGLGLGLTDGTNNVTLALSNTYTFGPNIGSYGQQIGAASQSWLHSSPNTFGVTSDATKSGIIAELSNITTSLDGYYYIVIATTTKTDIEVDIDEVVTDLNGKADTDLSNVPNSKGILTESYVNGTSWYRVYSDGWCEQGGNVTTQGSVTLLKPYKDTSYNVCCGNSYTTSSTNTNSLLWSKQSSSSIYFASYPSFGNEGADWQACGYIR